MTASWDAVADYTKAAQEKGCDPAAWAAHLSVALSDAAVPFPSPELAHVLIVFLCGDKNEPIAWKYIERAITAGLAPAMLVLALLSSRVIPSRHSRPVAYRLYMELLHRHGFSFAYQIKGSCFKKIMISVDEVLHLSQSFGTQTCEPGVLVVEFVFCIIWQLLDATLDDEGLLELTPDKKSKWATQPQYMEVDGEDNCDKRRIGSREKLRQINSVMAVELIGQFLHHKSISRLLFLALDNIQKCEVQRLSFMAFFELKCA